MALIPKVGRNSTSNRILIWLVYCILSIMGICMVVPFMITLTGSVSNDFDYDRFSPVPRYWYSEKDRYVRGLSAYFNKFRAYQEQLRAYFPEVPEFWSNWAIAGKDAGSAGQLAEARLNRYRATLSQSRAAAEDYYRFVCSYPVSDTNIYAEKVDAVNFLIADYSARQNAVDRNRSWGKRRLRQAALAELNREWGTSYESFYNIDFSMEMSAPFNQQGYLPEIHSERYQAFERFKKNRLLINTPATPVIPYALRQSWYDFLNSEAVSVRLGKSMSIELYNRLAGTAYKQLFQTPFPIPGDFGEEMQELWREFQTSHFPIRLIRLQVTPALERRFQAFAEETLKGIDSANRILNARYSSWSDIRLPAGFDECPEGTSLALLWKNFVTKLPVEFKSFSSSEIAFQKMVMDKYGSLAEINACYGTQYRKMEEIFPPFADAYTQTFLANQFTLSIEPILKNYTLVVDYLLFSGNAIWVTALLIALTILFTLTINPVAAYALSRFNLRGQDKIILFMLATMAFPTMVSAIPAYLLMRDLGLLNTLWALVIPGAANGMGIFILKGFFDSLPQELFEAATIDGASEWQIFRIVAMPLVKPILAINCLNAFMAAYNGWEWALIICQDKDMWTIAVWLYQASQWWGGAPWLVSAGFVLASLPTLIVFLCCQKMILRGIVIPTMK